MLDNSHLSPSVPTHRSKNIQDEPLRDEAGIYTGVICHRIWMAAVSPSPPLPSRRPSLCSPRCTSEASGVKPGSLRSHSHKWTGSHPHCRNTAFLLDGQKKSPVVDFSPAAQTPYLTMNKKALWHFTAALLRIKKYGTGPFWWWEAIFDDQADRVDAHHVILTGNSRIIYLCTFYTFCCCNTANVPAVGSIKVYLICVSKRPFRGKLSIAQAKCVTAAVHLLCSKLLRACVLSVAATCLNEATMKV